MKKPKPQKVEHLDYHECMKFLENKYKFKADDFANKFTVKGVNDKVPYLNFWHWICDAQNPGNGGYIYFDKSNLDKDCVKEKWIRTIMGYILKEFADNKGQVKFHVEW